MLICQQFVGILTFMDRKNFMLSWVEHENIFITSCQGILREEWIWCGQEYFGKNESDVARNTLGRIYLMWPGILLEKRIDMNRNSFSRTNLKWPGILFAECIWCGQEFFGKNESDLNGRMNPIRTAVPCEEWFSDAKREGGKFCPTVNAWPVKKTWIRNMSCLIWIYTVCPLFFEFST